MKQLSKAETFLFLAGGVLMVAGAGCYVFFILQGLVCFLVLAGSLLFAAMQARQRYEGTSITLRRLRRIQFFALACFVCAGEEEEGLCLT